MANAQDLVDEALEFPNSNIPENKFFIYRLFVSHHNRIIYYLKNYPGYEITQTKTFIKVVIISFWCMHSWTEPKANIKLYACMHTCILPSYNFVPLKLTPFTKLQEATKKNSLR